jgi:uncharacterized integral membrane protein
VTPERRGDSIEERIRSLPRDARDRAEYGQVGPASVDEVAPSPVLRWSRRARWIALASLAIAEVVLWTRAISWYPSLPERFPIHFDAAGAPDRWSARGPSWFLLPALSLGILAIFALIAWSIGPLARGAPGLVNVPRKDLFMRLPPAARERVLVPTRAYLVWVVSLVTWLFVWIVEGTARVAVGQAATLSSWPVLAFLALVLTTLVPLYAATSRVMKDAASRGMKDAASREDTP